MALDINISHDFNDLKTYLTTLKTNIVVQAARRAINRAIITGRKESGVLIRKELRIKARTLKNDHMRIAKATGRNLGTLMGVLSFNTKGLPMLQFVKGSKQPRRQKGVPVKRRTLIKVEVKPGRTKAMPKIFIAKSQGKSRVLRRADGGTRIRRQHVPSVSHFFDTKGGIKRRTIQLLQRRFTEIFQREMEVRLNKIVKTRRR